MKKPITTSIFDLFKVGPGPSSSHTIGPMKAALQFVELAKRLPKEVLGKSKKMEILLYGSLSATGRGHGTDGAVLAGLLGWNPENCSKSPLKLAEENQFYELMLGEVKIPFSKKDIHFREIDHPFPYSNTMVFHLLGDKKILLEEEFYSIGGGFILRRGEIPIERTYPPFPYSTMEECKELLRKNPSSSIVDILLANEEGITGKTKKEILAKLETIVSVMVDSVERGLAVEGVLPGPLQLHRKARSLHKKRSDSMGRNKHMIHLSAYAMAAAEENAEGHLIVTAPTSGASGVLPGLVYLLLHDFSLPKEKIVNGLIVSAFIGFLAQHNASISGAEVGCQGEIGVASAMGAAFLAAVEDSPIEIIENSAEIALEHQLGLTCDPVGGYVQIPCIERNAKGASFAYNAYLMASYGDPSKHKVGFDCVLQAMLETGKNMSSCYKETAKGGLARYFPCGS